MKYHNVLGTTRGLTVRDTWRIGGQYKPGGTDCSWALITQFTDDSWIVFVPVVNALNEPAITVLEWIETWLEHNYEAALQFGMISAAECEQIVANSERQRVITREAQERAEYARLHTKYGPKGE